MSANDISAANQYECSVISTAYAGIIDAWNPYAGAKPPAIGTATKDALGPRARERVNRHAPHATKNQGKPMKR